MTSRKTFIYRGKLTMFLEFALSKIPNNSTIFQDRQTKAAMPRTHCSTDRTARDYFTSQEEVENKRQFFPGLQPPEEEDLD